MGVGVYSLWLLVWIGVWGGSCPARLGLSVLSRIDKPELKQKTIEKTKQGEPSRARYRVLNVRSLMSGLRSYY